MKLFSVKKKKKQKSWFFLVMLQGENPILRLKMSPIYFTTEIEKGFQIGLYLLN